MLLYTILIATIIIYGILDYVIQFKKERILISCFRKKKQIRISNIFLFLIFVFIFIVTAFRGDFSSDYISYENLFANVIKMSWIDLLTSGFKIGGYGGVEIGFYVFMKLISYISTNPIVLFISVTLLTLISVYNGIKEESESRWFSLLFFVIFGSFFSFFNVMRAIFAYSLLFSMRHYLYERRYFLYTIIIILVCFVHISSIIMVFVVILDYFKFKNKDFLLFFLPISFVLFIFSEKLILLIDRLFYGNFFSTVSRFGIVGATFGNTIAPLLLGLVIICGTLIENEQDRIYGLWLKISVLWVFFRVLTIRFIVMRRFADMMSFYMILYFPYMINRLPFDRITKSLIKVILAFASIVFFFYTMKDSPINSYYFIWNR